VTRANAVQQLGEREVAQLDELIRNADEDVRRSDIAVYDAAAVRGLDRSGDLHGHAIGVAPVQYLTALDAADHLLEVLSFDQFHRQPAVGAGLVRLVYLNDVRMLELGHRAH
jgi:hypothetical protein